MTSRSVAIMFIYVAALASLNAQEPSSGDQMAASSKNWNLD